MCFWKWKLLQIYSNRYKNKNEIHSTLNLTLQIFYLFGAYVFLLICSLGDIGSNSVASWYIFKILNESTGNAIYYCEVGLALTSKRTYSRNGNVKFRKKCCWSQPTCPQNFKIFQEARFAGARLFDFLPAIINSGKVPK